MKKKHYQNFEVENLQIKEENLQIKEENLQIKEGFFQIKRENQENVSKNNLFVIIIKDILI